MPLTGHTYVNRAGGARLNHQQPYRTVVRIGGDESLLPPPCFFTTAIQQLRADTTERILVLADRGSAWDLAGVIVAALQAATPVASNLPSPSAISKQRAAHINRIPPWWNSSVAEVVEYDRTRDGDLMTITSAFRLASRAVWGDANSRLAHPLPRPRRKKYEIVWIWCPSRRGAEHDCFPLSREATDFEVHVTRARGGKIGATVATADSITDASDGGDGGERSCRRHLSVRSTWTGSRWYELSNVHSAA